MPHGLVLISGGVLIVAFGPGLITRGSGWLWLSLLWLTALLAVDCRLWRELRDLLPITAHVPARQGAWAAGLLFATIWFLTGWPVGAALGLFTAACCGLFLRRLVTLGLKADGQINPEILRLVLLLGAAFLLIHPYATVQLVGAGDAAHYARQMADVITQLRDGTLPVYVGQSLPAFEGSVHPLRTSPGLPYAGGLLDFLTGRSLQPAAILNLLIVLCLMAAITGGYAALSVVLRHQRWESAWLALLFGSSPGVLALAYAGDMFASWTALPWLPWLFLGWILAWRAPERGIGPCLQGGALALLWLTHAPIALWCTLLTIAAEFSRWIASGCRMRVLLTQAGAATLCLVLGLYVIVSVFLLEVPSNPYLGFDLANGVIFQSVLEAWAGIFRTVSDQGADLAHDLHLSPGLLAVAIVGVITLHRNRATGLVLATTAVVLFGLLVPWRGVTDRFWSAMPVFVMTISEKWPVQRFYPILSALLPFWGALACRHPLLATPRGRRALLLVLALSVGWSCWEARKFMAHGHAVTQRGEATTRLFLPENNQLSRYSYEMWGHLPDFFSFGYMDPEMLVRLIQPLSGEILLSNLHTLQETAGDGVRRRFVAYDGGWRLEPVIILPPGAAHFVRFDFLGSEPDGTLLVEGRRLARSYHLPRTGGSGAFGPGSGQIRGFTVRNFGQSEERVVLRYVPRIPSSAPPGTVQLIPFDPAKLPIRLTGLMPFEIETHTENGGWLETPKILIPGYRVSVNGHEVTPARSPNSLLMVEVPAGPVRVRVAYQAPWILSLAFWISFSAVLAMAGFCVAWLGLTQFRPMCIMDRLLPRLGRISLVLAACGSLGWGVTHMVTGLRSADMHGRYAFRVQLPVGKHEVYETLLSWRDPYGATTSIVLFYESDRFVRIGCRKNGVLKVLTKALPASYFVPHDLEIFIGSQLPPDDRDQHPTMTDEEKQHRRNTMRVNFNGHPVWETDIDHQQGTDFTFAVGREIHPTTGEVDRFRGRILSSPRF